MKPIPEANHVIHVGESMTEIDMGATSIVHTSFRFCDLRKASFHRSSICYSSFIGCILNETDFSDASLDHVEFFACFSADDSGPTNFAGARYTDISISCSQLNSEIIGCNENLRSWRPDAARAAADGLSPRNDVRNEAAARLGGLNEWRSAFFLGFMLSDPEWDVRQSALQSIGVLAKENIPCHREELLEWVFACLGDPHSLVREATGSLLEIIKPSARALSYSIERIRSKDTCDKIAGLRACTTLFRLDPDLPHELVKNDLEDLISDPCEIVRAEVMHLLGILDDAELAYLMYRGLQDPDPEVKIATLRAIALLSVRPSVDVIRHLLWDDVEEVRVETIYAIGQVGQYDRDLALQMRRDPSDKVRRLAKKLLDRD